MGVGDRIYGRAKQKLVRERDRGYRWAAPHARRITNRLSGSTVAILEYEQHPEARWGWGHPPNPWLQERFMASTDRYREVIENVAKLIPQLRSVPREHSRPGQPCWRNDYFAALDAAVLWAILAERRPRTFLEVGSGFSTLFARAAITENELATRIVSIDPYPRADVDAVCDDMHRLGLAEADLGMFSKLEPGDVVLIDGSHTAFMNSDTAVTWFDVVPLLPRGVLLGIHDIFLPWDYPPEWKDRWYGEQYVVGAFLMGEPAGWEIEFPAWFVAKETELCEPLHELWEMSGYPADWGGASFWMERTA